MQNLKNRCVPHILTLLVFVFINSPVKAETNWSCFGAGMAEIFVPGVGYVINGQVDKAVIIGGSRWITSSKAYEAQEQEDYEDDPEKIYDSTDAEDSKSGKEEMNVYLNRSTWDASYFGTLNFNLLLTTWGDMYMHGCKPNNDTYGYMLAPFNVGHFYDKWMFWLPILVLIGNYQTFDDNYIVNYYLEKGLTEQDLKRDSFSKYYMVGVGEEMFFRGTVQHYFFESFQESFGFSPSTSRHLSIAAGSAVFAAAHSGAGFTANPTQAFLFGLYEGYVYHPSLEEFDLTTAIAIHAWWDILVAYAILNHAEFHEDQEDVYDESKRTDGSMALNSQTVFPILKVGFMF